MPKVSNQPVVLKLWTHKPVVRNSPGIDLPAAYTALISAYEHTLRQTRPTDTISSPQTLAKPEK